jgi:hypothetical protein
MAKQNRTTLKGYFETGDIPNQNQYAELIDSQLNLKDTSLQIVTSEISASGFASQNHITASGNISASGNLYGVSASLSMITASGNITTYGGTGSFGKLEAFTYSPINVDGHITASGNISASGYVSCSALTIAGSVGEIKAMSGSISASGTITATNGFIGALTTTGIVSTGTGTFTNIISLANISASGYLVAQNITASNNISASGIVYGTTGSFSHLQGNSPITVGDSILFQQNITASSNISASGRIIATSFTGSLQGTASTASIATTVTLTATNTTNATHYLTFTDATTGNENVRTDTTLTYNPFSNTLATTRVNSSTYQYNTPESLTAGGANLATATPITKKGPVFVTGVTGRGILLPSWSETVYILTIHNMSKTDSFLLYPYFGQLIGTLGINVPATVLAGGSIILTSGGPNEGQWFGYIGNAIT